MNRLEVKPFQIKVFKEKRQGRRRRFLGKIEQWKEKRWPARRRLTRALLRATSVDPVSSSHYELVGDDPSSELRRNANAEPSSESRGNIGTDPDSGYCARALLRAASTYPVSGSHDGLMGDDSSSESRRNVGADPNSGSCVRALLRAASADLVSSSYDELMSVDPFSAPTPTHTR
ncbi:hypothetical protein FH972_019891 [Carpinus fangiana]|uniref:Uncharacterized protein n=1 Tax=Carpinus fangiana TaxID=176857 RepID=A0A5N6RVX3_9ROSI|nr:hypothetical protein FH972_019891 [Carpinus fangiana]